MGDDRSITTCGPSLSLSFLSASDCDLRRWTGVSMGSHIPFIFFVSQIFHMQPDPLDAMASRDAAPAFSAR